MSIHPAAPQVLTDLSRPHLDLLPRPQAEISPPPPQQTRRAPREFSRFSLGSIAFRCCWLAIFCFHLVNGAATLGTLLLYNYLADPFVAYKYSALQVSTEDLRRIGYSFAAVTVLHGVGIASMMYHSLRQKQLAFESPAFDSRFTASSAHLRGVGSYRVVKGTVRVWLQTRQWWNSLFSRNGYFGLNGPFFETWFSVREALEIVLQTYQAYCLSTSVPRRWINTLAVTSIFLNCMSTPVAHVIWRGPSKEMTRRIACLLSDMVLDFCCSIVVPACIFYPYWREFDPKLEFYRDELYYNDAWYVNAIVEGRQILVTSVPDYISTLMPHFSIVSSLFTIKSLFQRAPACRSSVTAGSTVSVEPFKRSVSLKGKRSKRKTVGSTSPDAAGDSALPHAPPSRWGKRRQILLNLLFVVWGFLVGVVHYDAGVKTEDQKLGCKLQIHAWFATNYSCSVMEVNCYRQQIVGDVLEIESILQAFERKAMVTLLITHCPALHMPPMIQQFPRLAGLEIFNCSIVEWDSEAALIQGHHDLLHYMFVMYSNLSVFPTALLHDQLPPSFMFLRFDHTNLSTLPDDVGRYWQDHEWNHLGFEFCQFEQVPPVLSTLTVYQLGLAGNFIQFIPDTLFEEQVFMGLALSDNPLQALPESIGDTSALVELSIFNTNVSTMPNWLVEWGMETLVGDDLSWHSVACFHTPLCDSASGVVSSDSRGNVSASEEQLVLEKLCAVKEILDSNAVILAQRLP